MDVPVGLLALAAVIVVAAYILQPFFAPRRRRSDERSGESPTAPTLRRRADLLKERNRIYSAIRELDFDFQTNKLSEEDYARQRHALVAQGIEVLQQLDALPADDDDPIEVLIAAVREGAPVPSGGFCPQCGQPTQPGDRFCGACGARL